MKHASSFHCYVLYVLYNIFTLINTIFLLQLLVFSSMVFTYINFPFDFTAPAYYFLMTRPIGFMLHPTCQSINLPITQHIKFIHRQTMNFNCKRPKPVIHNSIFIHLRTKIQVLYSWFISSIA